MKKIKFFLILFGLLALPAFAVAQSIQSIITNIVNNVAWPIAVGVVVILWIATGVLFLVALGDPAKLGTAKKALFASVAGTIIIVIAGSALAIIGNALGV